MAGFVVDSPKVELLDQMLVDLDQSFGTVPADLKEVVTEATSALHRLRNGLKCQFSEKVAQLARDNRLGDSIEALRKFFPELKIDNVVNILKLIYIEDDNLKIAILFVLELRDEFWLDAYKALYEDVRRKGHTDKPEILLLQRSMKRMLVGDDSEEMFKQVDEDCTKIIDRIVTGVKDKDYTLSKTVFSSLGDHVLDSKISSIVEKVHAAGTLEETLMLIKFSTFGLTRISNQCALIQAIFNMLKSKNLLQTEQAMHLWARAKAIREYANFAKVGQSEQEKCITSCNELDKNKKVYFQMYQKYVENSDGQKLGALHKDNCYVYSFVSEFVNFYYDGDVRKVRFLLSAAWNITFYRAIGRILSSLHKKMSELEQLHTIEVFEIHSIVKWNMNCGNYFSLRSLDKRHFEELKAKAPPCLRLLLWPEAEGAKFRLINKFLKTPLLCTNLKVYCRPTSTRKDSQFWIAQVDTSTCLTTFTIDEKRQHSKMLSAKTAVRLTDSGTKWKVTAVDEHHIKLYHQDKCLTADLTSSLDDDADLKTVSMKEENNSSLQLWRVEAI